MGYRKKTKEGTGPGIKDEKHGKNRRGKDLAVFFHTTKKARLKTGCVSLILNNVLCLFRLYHLKKRKEYLARLTTVSQA